jgi:hypothetical protein
MVNKFTTLCLLALCTWASNLNAQTDDETTNLGYFFYKTTGVDSVIIEGFDTITNKLVPAGLQKYTYNALCNITRISEKEWDFTQKKWVDVGQIAYNYDAQNRLTSTVDRPISGGIGRDSARTLFNYTGAETLPANQISQVLFSGAWVNEKTEEFTYTAAKKLATQVQKEWNGTTWDNKKRTTNTFDTQNRLITKVNEVVNGTAWVNDERSKYTYTTQNKLAGAKVENWVRDSAKWAIPEDYPFVLSPNGRKLTIDVDLLFFLLRADFAFSATGFLDTSGIYIGIAAPNTPFQQISRNRYIYNTACQRTATRDIAFLSNAATVLPNPTTDKLNIRLNNVEGSTFAATITNTSGQIVDTFNWTGTIDQQKDVSTLPNGLYFLSIQGEKWQTVQKFVVQK